MSFLRQLSLEIRLSMALALISCIVFMSIAGISYQNMKQMLSEQQNQILAARIQRIELFLGDAATFQILVQHPKLYENMLGQEDSLLILKNLQRHLIVINPLDIQLPALPYSTQVQFVDNKTHQATTRLAYKSVYFEGQSYQLIAGKQLAPMQVILQHYLWKLIFNSLMGVLILSVLGWWIGHYLLRSIRLLILDTREINAYKLSHRIQVESNSLEVQQLSQAMNEMLDKIQGSYEQLARFSEDIAHELRTPLNNLIGQTQITLSQSRSSSELEQLLYSHLEEYDRLTKMIENMLFIARSEHSQYIVEKQQLQLEEVIAPLLDYFSFIAEEKNMTFQLTGAECSYLWANLELLQRALSNLIINAIDYGQQDGKVSIFIQQHVSTIEIAVLTHEIFIEAQHLNYLFDRFYQVDESRHAQARTGGLGLAIVQSIMHLHQGDVSVSNSKQGVIFRLFFPSE
ncbi:heavy metal sensor histidine kinase [Acinetobacter sp. ANC 4648]|uniref:heavy metal sensor histidine kinase n=1 Tax=Acinetobacter sp. ANC 4648 TaxID=1977875 RepID=UPI000A3496C7|nr:heavy metal sensor histidine kinase [Acinetobacter sp. ANC 4648]OTG81630.1 two-component sensor histidine kinase [Acinetobacter sp. ANC 4648]